jgi:Resolvase, N terminal domain
MQNTVDFCMAACHIQSHRWRLDMTKRAAIYVRVSTDKQTVENQVRELRQIAERRGWQVVEEYRDAGISGAKGCPKSPWSRSNAQRCQPAPVRRCDGLGDRSIGAVE